MLIRPATEHDIPNIVEGIKHFVSTSSYKRFGVNEVHVAATLRSLIPSPDAIVVVLDTDQGFGGAFVGLIHPHLFSGERMLGELFLYTAPHTRGHGPKIKAHVEEVAIEKGAKFSTLAHPIGEEDLRLDKVYRRWGYVPIETNYLKELG